MWFSWTAPAGGTATFDSAGSGLDTLLAVYEGGSVNGLAGVAANDVAGGTLQSRVERPAVAGHTYRLAVDGYNGAGGQATLRWVLRGSSDDPFSSAQALSGSTGSMTGSTVGANREAGEPRHAAGNSGGASIRYRWTTPVTADVEIKTFGSSFDILLGVYRGAALSALTREAENDDAGGRLQSRVRFRARARVTSRIAIDGYGGATGATRLTYLVR